MIKKSTVFGYQRSLRIARLHMNPKVPSEKPIEGQPRDREWTRDHIASIMPRDLEPGEILPHCRKYTFAYGFNAPSVAQ
jgi:hypothetical protein